MVTAAELPDPIFARSSIETIWLGPQQQAGLTHLCSETPFRVLVGPRSCGKTTLLRHFRHHLDEVVMLDLVGPQTSAADVLAGLLEASALAVDGLAESEQRSLLAVFLRERRSLGLRIILCIDDVTGIAPAAWDEIMQLCAIEAAGKPLLELAVVGETDEAKQYPLRELVQDGRTSAVEAVRYLASPDDEDIGRYLAWQLRQIGNPAKLSAEACSRINELGHYRFAEVNRLFARILAAPFSAHNATLIDVQDVEATAGRLRQLESASEPPLQTELDIPPDRIVIERKGTIERIVTLSGRLVIGRSDHSDLQLDGPRVSRNHAMIVTAEGGNLALVDLNSAHGVFVNGQRVSRQLLRAGDVITLCQYRLSLVRGRFARSAASQEVERLAPLTPKLVLPTGHAPTPH